MALAGATSLKNLFNNNRLCCLERFDTRNLAKGDEFPAIVREHDKDFSSHHGYAVSAQ